MAIKILVWAVAFFLPLILFLEVLDNINERKPYLVFLLILPIWAGAAMISSKPGADRKKWLGWSMLLAVIYSCMLAFFF